MITFDNVSLIYPHSLRTIFEDLSFTIEEGEMVLVIGGTGSGKSSLLRLINGLGVNTARRKHAVLIIIEMKYFLWRPGRSSESAEPASVMLWNWSS